jgi:hypothetical protein
VLVTVAVLAVTVVLAVGFTRVDFATGQDSYLNPSSQVAKDNLAYQDAFGGETVILLFEMDEGTDVADLFTPANIAEFERVEKELRAIPEVYAVVSPFTSMEFSHEIAVSGVGTNALISAAERETDPAAQALRQTDIQVSLARLGEVGEQDMQNPAWNDFLIYANDGYTLTDGALAAPADPDRIIRTSLLSTFPNQQVAVGGVLINGNASLDELGVGTDAVVDVMSTATFENATLTVTGAPLYLSEINDYLQQGMATLGLVAIVVMAVVLTFLFRVRLRLLPLLTVLVGVVWAFSALGYLGIDLSLVTISGLPILIGLGIDFAIQMHNRIAEESLRDKESHPVSEAMANLAPAIITATITAVVAFMALQVSKVPMIRDFGVLLAVGIVVVMLTALVIPAMVLGARHWKPAKAERGPHTLERVIVWLGSLPSWSAVPIAAVAVVLLFVGVNVEEGTRVESDPVRWIDQGSQTVEDIRLLEERTGFSSTLGILVQANNVLDPTLTAMLDEFIRDADARDRIVGTDSLVGTMSQIIEVPGTTELPPTRADMEGGAASMPPDVAKVLLADDLTATQVNLRLAPQSLEEQAVLVQDLRDDLDARLAGLDLPSDSVLTVGLPAGQPPVKAVPSGLAVVGVGLLENLSANRALLTYLALAAAALWLVLRHRSLARGLLALIPVVLAIGLSGVLVWLLDVTLSPLTTVSGPLIIATCTEFSVLILARYLEEREHSLEPKRAVDTAARRTGRAFFTSAVTVISGFAVLAISPLPLLRDFGLVVTMNVATAVLAALVVMPPAMVWADVHGLIGVEANGGAVRLAARPRGAAAVATSVAAIALAVGVLAMVSSSDLGSEEAVAATGEFTAVTLPPTTTTEPAATVPEGPVDPSAYGTERPAGTVAGALFDLMTAAGLPANQAVCTAEVLLGRVSEADLLAMGIATFEPAAVEPVAQAALDCGVPQESIDALLATVGG